MANYYHIYTNNPSAGLQDGTVVSENGLMTAPISVTLDATRNESKVIKCAIRCEEGYESSGTSFIQPYHYDGTNYTPTGGNVGRWQVAKDLSISGQAVIKVTANASPGDTITVGDVALTAGTDFSVGSSIEETAGNIAAAIKARSEQFTTTVSGALITITEIYPGGGHTPYIKNITGPGSGSDAKAATLSCSQTDSRSSFAAVPEQMAQQGVWGSRLSITDIIRDKNVIFWIKVSSSSEEAPERDSSTVIHTEVVVQAI